MADTKPTTGFYSNLGGINSKASDYSTGKAQFLQLYNMDFDVPNALQKRPGHTQAVTPGTSGPVNSLFEFIKLDGSSYVVAGTDTAMFYLASNQFTLLSSGWTNGQPTDMLTFVNKLWMANGQNFQSWGATGGVSAAPAGLGYYSGVTFTSHFNDTDAATYILVGGYTATGLNPTASSAYVAIGIWVATSGVRADGYFGPIDPTSARQIIQGNIANSGDEWFSNGNTNGGSNLPILKTSSTSGITATAIWLALDRLDSSALPTGATLFIGTTLGVAPYTRNGIGTAVQRQSGGGAYATNFSDKVSPTADMTKFYFYTMIPTTQSTFTVIVKNWDSFVANSHSFSGLPFNFYATFTPKYIEVNQNIMFMAGFSSSPSTVWFSDVGAPESIQPDYNFEVRTNDGDRIMALAEFQNQLMVFKETSFHKLIGNSAENFELIQISSEYGCLSNRCVIPYANNVAFLDRKGIVNYNGASWDVISNPVESIFRRMNLAAARENATGLNHIYRNQLWFAIPVDNSTTNNITVVYDYLVDGWTFFDGYSPASYAYVKAQLSTPTEWHGSYSGLIHYSGSSFYSDSGRAITAMAFTHFENFGGQNVTSIWRRLFLDVAPAVGLTGRITGQVFSDYNRSTVQATFSVFQSQFQTRAEMGVVGKAVAAQFSHSSASLPLLINGYAWANRPLRNV